MKTAAKTIKTVSYWKGRTHVTESLSKDSLSAMLAEHRHGDNIIVTDRGNIYSSSSTPGYCDGDTTMSHKEATALMAAI